MNVYMVPHNFIANFQSKEQQFKLNYELVAQAVHIHYNTCDFNLKDSFIIKIKEIPIYRSIY